MRNILKLLLVAVFTLQVSAASAQDYSQYVSIGITPELRAGMEAQDFNPADYELSAQDRANAERTLAELASTPEGLEAMREAAEHSPSGTVHVIGRSGDITLAASIPNLANVIAIGTEDNNTYYISPETNQAQKLTMQRIMYHELIHLSEEGLHKASEHGGINHGEESRAVYATNEFMKRYYGEPARSTDTADESQIIVGGGAGSFPMSSDFNQQLATTNMAVINGDMQSVLNKYTSLGGGNTDSRRSSNDYRQTQPFSFLGGLANFAPNVSRYVNANGDYSGERYRNGGGTAGGFSLDRGADSVRSGRGGNILTDAFNGDGTFMGQQTGNVFQGTFTGFNPTQGLTGGTTATTGTSSGTSITGGTTATTTTSTSSGAPPPAIGTGPR